MDSIRGWLLALGLLVILGIVLILAGGGEGSSTFSQTVTIEDEGKRNAAATATGRSLRDRFGDDLRIVALERHRVDDHDLIGALFPEFPEGAIGCIIVAYADGEGAVFVEDPKLRIIHEEPLSAFVERTRRVDPDLVAAFYLSLG